MSEFDFSKGSVWRKWDLHFHSQSSHDYQDKSVTDEEIIAGLIEKRIEAVVITDHHKIDDADINDLINIFKEIKRYRQVIIVTHNANIVVNADAGQVIVASNNEERLSYESGSLENPDIKKAVCNILEGGKIAFRQRRNKYHLN